jgi:hypothetical protein
MPPLSPTATRTLRLIATYLAGVDAMVVLPLTQGLGAGHPLSAWQEGKLPSRGKLPKPFTHGTYHFRAHGCVVHWQSRRIEFDFGPAGRHDGFTPFYLRQHVRLNKTIRRLYHDLDVYAGVAELEQAGLVFRPNWEPTPHLMYLTTEGKARAKER